MSERASQTGLSQRAASRRQLVKLLAASPLLGLAYQGLPAAWQEALAHESRHGAERGMRCPGCGAEMPFRSSAQGRPQAVQDPVMPPQNALEEQLTGQLIETVDDAVNIWDFNEAAGSSVNFPLGDPPPGGSLHSWTWFRLSSREGPFPGIGSYESPTPVPLTAGQHTFHLIVREDGAYMDALYATMDETFDANAVAPR